MLKGELTFSKRPAWPVLNVVMHQNISNNLFLLILLLWALLAVRLQDSLRTGATEGEAVGGPGVGVRERVEEGEIAIGGLRLRPVSQWKDALSDGIVVHSRHAVLRSM